MYIYAMVCVWRSEGTLGNLALSFHVVVPGCNSDYQAPRVLSRPTAVLTCFPSEAGPLFLFVDGRELSSVISGSRLEGGC